MRNPNVLITGSSGFLGKVLVSEILAPGSPVTPGRLVLFDIAGGPEVNDERVRFIKGDLCNYDEISAACHGINLLIHAAAIVDWGTRSEEEVYRVNVTGTENVIRACRENGVGHLVYTSSLDAVYSGKPLVNIDESLPYPDKHTTMYCRSKFLAEKMVLEANDVSLKTCVIRPSDIYGEGDPFHIGSLIDMAKGGFYVRLGDGSARSQHTYVVNCAWAHLLAGSALMSGNPAVPGNAYFITDAPGTNFFRFYDRFVIEAGYRVWPKNLWLPRGLALFMGAVSEAVAWLVSPVKKYNPKFSRFAVIYTCSDFTFSSEKAKRDFGFVPKIREEEAVKQTIGFYKAERSKSGF